MTIGTIGVLYHRDHARLVVFLYIFYTRKKCALIPVRHQGKTFYLGDIQPILDKIEYQENKPHGSLTWFLMQKEPQGSRARFSYWKLTGEAGNWALVRSRCPTEISNRVLGTLTRGRQNIFFPIPDSIRRSV